MDFQHKEDPEGWAVARPRLGLIPAVSTVTMAVPRAMFRPLPEQSQFVSQSRDTRESVMLALLRLVVLAPLAFDKPR